MNDLSNITKAQMYRTINLIAYKEKVEASDYTREKLEYDLSLWLRASISEITGEPTDSPGGGTDNIRYFTQTKNGVRTFQPAGFSIDYDLAKQMSITQIASSKQLVTLPAADVFLHGSVIVDKYVFFGTRPASTATPSRIIRALLSDLNVYQEITLDFNGAEQLTYIAEKDRIYIAHHNAGSVLNVTELNPYTLEKKPVISGDVTTTQMAFPSSATDGTYLYISAGAQGVLTTIRLRRYRLSDFQFVSELDTGIQGRIHSFKYDGFGGLYMVTTYRTVAVQQYMIKINTTNFTLTGSIAIQGESWTDGIGATADDLFLGMEYIFNSQATFTIARVKRDLSAVDYFTFPTIIGSAYEVFFDGTFIYALTATSPGNIIRIDPQTLETAIYTTPTGEESPNEILFSGQNFYVAYWQSPAKIAKYNSFPFQQYGQMKYVSGNTYAFALAGTGSGGSSTAYQDTAWVAATPVDITSTGTNKNMTGVAGNQTFTLDGGLNLVPGTTKYVQINKTIDAVEDIVFPAGTLVKLFLPSTEATLSGVTTTLKGLTGSRYSFKIEQYVGYPVVTVTKLISDVQINPASVFYQLPAPIVLSSVSSAINTDTVILEIPVPANTYPAGSSMDLQFMFTTGAGANSKTLKIYDKITGSGATGLIVSAFSTAVTQNVCTDIYVAFQSAGQLISKKNTTAARQFLTLDWTVDRVIRVAINISNVSEVASTLESLVLKRAV